MIVVVFGPAGSGKTTLVGEFGRYLSEQEFSVAYVNLDCAVESLPYRPNFDVRNYFTLVDVMRRFGLGPNGALVKSMELLLDLVGEVSSKLEKLGLLYDYVFVDTPGQLELTLFHDAVVKLVESFARRGLALFLTPADMLKRPRDLVFLNLMALAVRVRFEIPLVTVLTKADLLDREFVERLRAGVAQGLGGLEEDLVAELASIVDRLEKKQRLIKVSAITREGFDDLQTILHEVFCTCGELT